MKYVVLFILTLGLSLSNWASAQDSVVVKGKVLDKHSEKPIKGAKVYLVNDGKVIYQTMADSSGDFQIKTSREKIRLQVSYLGYELFIDTFRVKEHEKRKIIQLNSSTTHCFPFENEYYPPLYSPDRFTQGDIITNEEIMRLPLSK